MELRTKQASKHHSERSVLERTMNKQNALFEIKAMSEVVEPSCETQRVHRNLSEIIPCLRSVTSFRAASCFELTKRTEGSGGIPNLRSNKETE